MKYYATDARKKFLAEALYQPIMESNLNRVMFWSQWDALAEKEWEESKKILVSAYSELFKKTTDWVIPCVGRDSVHKHIRIYMSGAGYHVGIVPLEGIVVVKENKQKEEMITAEILMAHAYAKARSRTVNVFAENDDVPMRLNAPALRLLSDGANS